MFGENPHGFLNYSPDGRMIALITRARPQGRRRWQADAGRGRGAVSAACSSYAGAYTIEGDVVTHHVDISWNESFTGGEQKRHFSFEGDRLILSHAAVARSDRRQDERAPDDVGEGLTHQPLTRGKRPVTAAPRTASKAS